MPVLLGLPATILLLCSCEELLLQWQQTGHQQGETTAPEVWLEGSERDIVQDHCL